MTTLPAPMTLPFPMVMPGRIMTPPPIQQPSSIVTGRVGMADVFNSFIRFHGSEAFIQINGVRSGVNLYVGGDQHIVADGDPVAVHERAARIDGDVVSDMDVAAVIADEGMADGDLGADAAQHFLQHLPLFLLMVVRQGIVFHQEPVRLVLEFQKHLVMAVIPFARHAFFQFSHYFLLS